MREYSGVLRRMFGVEKDEMTGVQRKLYDGKFEHFTKRY
jgi:hypothetical protein